MAVFPVTVAESAVITARTPGVGSRYGVAVADRGRLGVFPTDNAGYRLVKGVALTIADHARLRLTVAALYRAGGRMVERGRMRDITKPIATYHVTLKSGTLRIRGKLAVGVVQHLLERGVMREGVLRASPMVRMREKLRMSAKANVAHHFAVLMRSAATFRLVQRVGIGASVRVAMRAADRLTRLYKAVAIATEQLHLADTVGVQLLIAVVERETAELTDAQLVRAVLSGHLTDTAAFTIAIFDPGSTTTTWAINTRTGAVTEYTGFDFSSYARLAGGTFVATADDGLYELNADTDDGEPIVADMISGLIEMTGSTFTSLRAAYLAVRGEGEYLLKLTAGSGRSTTYRVLTKPLTTARINTGKGWRTRYFQFQLVSTGQDFDLQGLEFLPVASVRRI